VQIARRSSSFPRARTPKFGDPRPPRAPFSSLECFPVPGDRADTFPCLNSQRIEPAVAARRSPSPGTLRPHADVVGDHPEAPVQTSVIPEPFCTSSCHPSPPETPGASPASTTWALNLAGVDPPGTLGENSPRSDLHHRSPLNLTAPILSHTESV
jgi:hypothetical protein